MKTNKFKRAIVMLLAITMLLTSTGMASFAESMGEGADKVSTEAVVTESGSDAVQAAAEEAAAEINDEEVPEAAPAESAEPAEEPAEEAVEEAKTELTAKDWEAGLPDKISKDVREAMAQVAKSQLKAEGDLYKAFANAESLDNWDASFVMFVLEYANVLGVSKAIGDESKGTVDKDNISVPVNADTDKWIKALKDKGLFTEISEEAAPEQGDIVFVKNGGDTEAAVVLDTDENEITVIGAYINNVGKYVADTDKVLGFVSLKDVAPAEFKDEEPAEESAEEAAEAADDADKEDAEELTEEELAAKKAEEEAAAKAAEEATKAEEAGLTVQTIGAELTSEPGFGGKLRSLFTSNAGTEISVSGYLPEDATVKAYPVKVEIPGKSVLAAYDITIYVPEKDENGEPTGNEVEWQPEIPLNVSIKDKAIPESAEDLSVFHMDNKKAEPEQIGTVSAAAKSVEFEADSFSIYVVTQDADTVTYRFVENTQKDGDTWTGEYTQLRQILENGDKLVEPTAPTKEGSVFTGWYEYDPETDETSTTAYTDSDWTTVTVSQHEEGEDPISEEKILVAGFTDKMVKVTYYDQNESIVQTQEVENGSTINPNDKEGTNFVDYVPIQNQEGSYLLFEYWTDQPYGNKQKVGETTISSDISLYPVLGEAHYIYFDNNTKVINGAKASYVHSIQVAPGEPPAGGSSLVPSAPGYTFLGWYVKSDNSADADNYKVFNANGTLNDSGWNKLMTKSGAENLTYDPTLYAHWAPASNADYTVVIWTQNLNSEGTAVVDEYTYAESFTVENVSTTQDISLASDFREMNTVAGYNKMNVANNNNAGVAREGGTDNNISDNRTENPYYGFEFKRMKPESAASQNSEGSSVRIMPNGSTVLNVYYDRAEFTLTFEARDYTYTSTTSNNGTQYGFVNGDYVQLTRHGYGTSSNPYYWTYGNNTRYTGTRYTRSSQQSIITVNEIKRPYGVKLDDVFPVVRAGTTWPYKDTVDGKQHSARWDDQTSPKIYPNVIAKLPYMPGQNITFRYDDGSSKSETKLRYLVETVEDTDTYDLAYTHNGITKHYKEVYSLDVRYNYITKGEDVDLFEENKYSFVGATNGDDEDQPFGPHASYPESIEVVGGATYNFFYDRKTPLLTIKLKLDGDIVSNKEQTVNVKYEKVLTEDFLSAYKTTDIANTKEKTLIQDGVEVPYWWYYDEACKSPVELGKYSMPDHAVTLYQGLKTSYGVEVYPDGGELGGNINTYSTWFSVDKGERINPYENVSRDYIKVDSAPEDTTIETYWYDAHYANEQDKENRYAVYQPMDPEHQGEDIYIKSPGVYSFIGWFEVPQNEDPLTYGIPNGAIPFDFDAVVNGPVRLKAKWQLMSQFSIVYDAGEHVHAPVDSNTYQEGANAIVKPSRSNPVGKQFRGWKVQGQGAEGRIYKPNEEILVSEDIATVNDDGTMTITLEAVYDEGPYKDNYTYDYIFKVGDTEYYRQTLSPGEELVTPVAPSTPEGSPEGTSFTGWYEDSACTRKFSGFGIISNPVETTLYAGFAKQHTVTYYDAKKDGDEWVKGDNIIQVQKYNDGAELDTSKVIYEFDSNRYVSKWNVENGSAHQVDYKKSHTGYFVSSDLTVWPAMQDYLLLQYDSRGGSYVEPAKIPTDGSWPNRPKEPTRDGYQFLGWFTSPDQIYDENGHVNPSAGNEYDFDRVLPAGTTTLYAWWEPVGGKNTAEYTVIWWAQAASGDKTYEFQKSQKFTGKIGSTVDLTSNVWITENGFNPTSVNNLVNYYDSNTANDKSKYFEFAGADAAAAAAVNIDPSEVSAVIHDDGSTVLNLRFNRKRSWIGFDTDGKGTVYYKTGTYSGDNLYFIEGWLGREVADLWPAYDSKRVADTDHNKALVVVNSDYYSNWTPQTVESGLQAAATLQTVIDTKMLDSAAVGPNYGDKGNVLIYKLNTRSEETVVVLHYIKDGVEDTNITQELHRSTFNGVNYPGEDANKYKYTENYTPKSLTGYTLITDRGKRNPSDGGTYAGYNPDIGAHGSYTGKTGQFISGEVTTTTEKYTYTRKYPNRRYYKISGYDLFGLPIYSELTVYIGNSGERYDVGLKDGNNIYSGTVYYRDAIVHYSESLDQFKSGDFNETKTIETSTTTSNINVFFYYARESFNVNLMNIDGTTVKETLTVPYGDLVPDKLVGHDPTQAPSEGMTFIGWSVSPDTYEPFTSFMPARDITLYQIWEPTKVKVTTVGYDLNGDPVSEGVEDGVYEANYNSMLRQFGVRDPKNTEPGYTFGGWEKETVKDGQTKWVSIPLSERIKSDTLIRPVWKNMHAANVTYVLNGGTGAIDGTTPVEGETDHFIDSSSYLLGSKAEIKSGAALTKTEGTGDDAVDYSFVCWNTKADGSGEDYYAGDSIALSKHGITLYARYVAKRKVTLVYDLNTTDTNAKFYDLNATTGKYAVASNQSKQYLLIDSGDADDAAGKINKVYEAGKEINDSKEDAELIKFLPARPGYTFKGWSKTADGEVYAKDGDSIRVNTLNNEKVETLYAVWEEQRLPISVYEDDVLKNAGKKDFHLTSATNEAAAPDVIEFAYRLQLTLEHDAYTITDGYEYENAMVGTSEIDKLQYVFNDTTGSYEWQYHVKDADEDEFTPVGVGPVKVTFTNGELTITKTVDGDFADKTMEFEFTLTAVQDAPENATYKLVKGTGSPVNIAIGGTFTLKDGESAKIKLPRGKNITITETAVNGYTAAFTCGDGTESVSSTANSQTLKLKKSKGTLGVTNTAATGDLTVSKTVSNAVGEKITGLPVDEDQEYTFTLESVAGATGDTEFTFKKGEDESTIQVGDEFTLKHSENAVITLPQYKDVVITETPVNGYTAAFTCGTGTQEATGAAVENGKKFQVTAATGSLAVTNTLATGNLTVTKTVSGGFADESKLFKFTLNSVDGAVEGTDAGVEGTKFMITKNGGASQIGVGGTFELKSGESVTISLPQYRDVIITEDPDGYDATFTAGTGTTPATGQDATVENGLKFQVTAATASLGVTNVLDSGVLTISKDVTGQYGDQTRPFVFTLDEVEGAASTVEFDIVRGDSDPNKTNTKIKVGGTFALAHGEVAKITLPRGKEIKITEEQVGGYTATFTPGEGTSNEGAVTTGEGEAAVTIGRKVKLTADEGSLAVANGFKDDSVVPTGIAKSNMILIPLFLSLILALGILLSIIQRRRLASRTR